MENGRPPSYTLETQPMLSLVDDGSSAKKNSPLTELIYQT